jgi:hypothetical protein
MAPIETKIDVTGQVADLAAWRIAQAVIERMGAHRATGHIRVSHDQWAAFRAVAREGRLVQDRGPADGPPQIALRGIPINPDPVLSGGDVRLV